jgi:MarR family transcriptional regulator, lower aerobic nicotinate degradation pathway regulator
MIPMSVSRSVAALRRHGRLQEQPDPNNGRRKRLSLTDDGLSLYKELVPDIKKMSRFILSCMSKQELESLTDLVEKLIARLESLYDGPT